MVATHTDTVVAVAVVDRTGMLIGFDLDILAVTRGRRRNEGREGRAQLGASRGGTDCSC